MKRIVVGSAVLNQTALDWRGNARRIQEAIGEARQRNVSLLCLPELCIPGYGCEDAFLSPSTSQKSLEVLARFDTTGIVVAVGLPFLLGKNVYNVAALLAENTILGFVAKHSLAKSGVHYEPRWFESWPLGVEERVTVDGVEVPFGDLVFDLDGIRLGFEICEDAWSEERRAVRLAARGVDLVFNPSASHFAFGKFEQRKKLCREGAALCGAVYVYSNSLGNDAGRLIYDGGAIIAEPSGYLVCGPRFSFHERNLTTHLVELSPKEDHSEPSAVSTPVKIGDRSVGHESVSASMVAWEGGSSHKEEEFARAAALALFDYVRKSRSRGVVVSLSGGADSAAVACLVTLLVHLGCAELGVEEFGRRFHYFSELAQCRSEREIVGEFLTCVYQGTTNSTAVTREAARGVAGELGARFFEFEVEEIVQRYLSLVSGGAVTKGEQITWATHDLALQNIQARTRGPAVWLVANLLGALLVSTSNRSEAAVGYATMDGDTCGGLTPLGGIDKAFLLHWLKWLEQEGVEGQWRVGALSKVNSQSPTAELRPPEYGQTDERDLMPYVVLEAIERRAILERKTPLEVFRSLKELYQNGEYDFTVLKGWVEQFFRLWSQSQWKRERYAVSFHFDELNLDPKSWCRFPVLSGGFEEELEELRRES